MPIEWPELEDQITKSLNDLEGLVNDCVSKKLKGFEQDKSDLDMFKSNFVQLKKSKDIVLGQQLLDLMHSKHYQIIDRHTGKDQAIAIISSINSNFNTIKWKNESLARQEVDEGMQIIKENELKSQLSRIVADFSPITLNEMDEVKLMNRTDTKFAFKTNKLPLLLQKMLPFYHILTINGKLIHDYKSLYFDTEDRKFYIDHHNSRVNRNKIRFREYVGSNLTFLEIKLKNNKGKTIKKRMKVSGISEQLNEKQKEYIEKIIGKSLDISAKQWINFSRVTFVHKTQKERLTMDVNLTFKNQNNKGDLQDIVIAEVKQERVSRASDFMRITKEMSILPIRLSKYCISTMQLHPKIKQNRFKKKLLFINKLKQA
ncbi:MAG: polyphosphate polymerase domain-containing protein [Flavobacteriales bacterium]|nr:polyphosphate polymerase domain-containing protein [Flavobacteriales bacterium]